MRRATALILILVLLFGFSFSASSVTFDGYDEGYEWDSASTVLLINGSGNCNVNQGIAKFLVDNSENAVYFCLILNDKLLEQGNTESGFILYIGNNDYIEITANGIEKQFDNYKYTFSGAMSINENGGAFAEIRVGFKNGVPQKVKGKVSFIDYAGEPSDYCNFEIINTEYSEPAAVTVCPTTAVMSTAKAEKTTKVKTTKPKTTKRVTTKKTEKPKSTTSKSKKTTNKKSSFDFDIDFPDIVFNEQKTKVPKTEKVQNETTEKDDVNVTIYYVEKEVIISQVYLTSADNHSVVAAEPISSVQITEITSETENKTEQINKGMQYKTLVAVICSLGFAGAVIWSVVSTKKKTVNTETENNDK